MNALHWSEHTLSCIQELCLVGTAEAVIAQCRHVVSLPSVGQRRAGTGCGCPPDTDPRSPGDSAQGWSTHFAASAPFVLPEAQAGLTVPHPLVVLIQALTTLIEQLCALPDELRQQTVNRYRRLCDRCGIKY